jgi:hypothetical protein
LAPASTPIIGGNQVSRPPRLAVIRLGEHRLVSIEYLVPTGLNDHLPSGGVAVHLVSDDGRKFLAYYSRAGVLVGVVGGGMPGKVMKARAKIAAGAPVSDVLD